LFKGAFSSVFELDIYALFPKNLGGLEIGRLGDWRLGDERLRDGG
jgi:hypothetical protein